jgi:hypothetical protein
VAQQLREASPFGEGPRFLIRDNDTKFGAAFARVAEGSGIEVLTTPYQAPKANVPKVRAIGECFLGSVRRECLDFFLLLNERHLRKIMKQYQIYFNQARPHQDLDQSHRSSSETRARSSPSLSSVACITTISGEQPSDPRSLALPEYLEGDSFRPQLLPNTTAYNDIAFSKDFW